MKLSIIGTEFDQPLINHVKEALSATLSPVKKDAIVRSFLTRLVGANNEHELHQHFSDAHLSAPQNGNEQKITIITLKEFDCGNCFGEQVRLCGSDQAVERIEKELFTEFFNRYELKRVKNFALSHFDGLIDTIYYPDLSASDEEWNEFDEKKDAFIAEFLEYTSNEVINWLFSNADKNELMEDFIESLSDGQFSVAYDFEPLNM